MTAEETWYTERAVGRTFWRKMKTDHASVCDRCTRPLDADGKCRNTSCRTNLPTWRPSQSGERTASGGFVTVPVTPHACKSCGTPFAPSLGACPHCGVPLSSSGKYRAAVLGLPPAPNVPKFEQTDAFADPYDDDEPVTEPGTPIAKSSRPPRE